MPVITQVFPDEFHLNTLDQLLSATARLNPHVNIKAIVIGLMDRLSTYAARESESELPEDRQKIEEEATTSLLEKLRISKETESVDSRKGKAEPGSNNSKQTNGDVPADESARNVESSPDSGSVLAIGGVEKPFAKKNRGIPENVELYQIFYNQVINLVNAQRLHIQDTIALLVSLSNLAL